MTNPTARFDKADRAAMSAIVTDWAALDRTGPTDHAAEVISAATASSTADYPHWALIGTAADLVREIVARRDIDTDLLTADIPGPWCGAADAFITTVVRRNGQPTRTAIDEMVRIDGPVHALDTAVLVLRATIRLDGYEPADAAAVATDALLKMTLGGGIDRLAELFNPPTTNTTEEITE